MGSTSITDEKVSITKPRVNLRAAVALFAVPPSGLSATTASSNEIDLSWTDNSSDETGFKIERKTGSGGTYSEIATVSADITSYSNIELTASTTYYYHVRVYSSSGDSNYSSETNAATSAASGGGGGCFISTARP
ncbi:MAG: fibronectin type III domain-containing protein [Spirochaetaceae bacterium]|nr:fibronectin type III domain-containing protein [Spirochaetaceae bacterium]